MSVLGRFSHVRNIAICSFLFVLATTMASKPAEATKPKPPRNNVITPETVQPTPPSAEPRTTDHTGFNVFTRREPPSVAPSAPVMADSANEPIGLPVPLPQLQPFPVGAWRRNFGPIEQELVVGPNSFRSKVDLGEAGTPFVVHLAADYSMTADGLVYGVVSDVRIEAPSHSVDSPDDLAELIEIQRRLIDQPFSFRWRVVDDTLVVKDVRFAVSSLSGDDDDDEFSAMAKLYVAGSFERAKSTTTEKPW